MHVEPQVIAHRWRKAQGMNAKDVLLQSTVKVKHQAFSPGPSLDTMSALEVME